MRLFEPMTTINSSFVLDGQEERPKLFYFARLLRLLFYFAAIIIFANHMINLTKLGLLQMGTKSVIYDAIVVGSGLAGLTASLELSSLGYSVALIEKSDRLGGNSAKASSGINGTPTRYQDTLEDSVDYFSRDTIDSGKGLANPELVNILTQNSAQAVHWLADEFGVDLSAVSRLGGHSFARTHRGSGALPPGFAIVSALSKRIEQADNVRVMKGCSFERLIVGSNVQGIEVTGSVLQEILGKNIILATGGFCADFGDSSLLKRFRPDLLGIALTNGQETTGDGQKISERDLGAKLIHMDQIQVHPTGFIQMTNDESQRSKWKFLCGELIRGIGGVLLSPLTGNRFVNELTTRDEVTKQILESCTFGEDTTIAIIVVNSKDYLKAKSHIDFYITQSVMFKGTVSDILQKLKTLHHHPLTPEVMRASLEEYNGVVKSGKDPLGRTHFGHLFSDEQLYFGFVTPVLHFAMGGIEVNQNAQIMTNDGIVENVFAIGEVSGGVHGANRLAGSSLLECVVFGRHVAQYIDQKARI